MRYVDGYVLPIPKKNLKSYKKMAEKGGEIWLKYGALQYVETVGEDLKGAEKWGLMPFSKLAKTKPGETVVFSFIVYKSRAHRDEVNSKVMKDPLMSAGETKSMPFDIKRMAVGGFETIVDL